MIETGDIQVIIEDGTNANLCQQIAYIKAGKTEIEEAVQEGIGDFNTNATEKTNTFNSNASAKTLAFNQNADAKTLIYDNNASDKLTAYNENATNKLADFNTNATNKTTAFDLNATSKTNDFNYNASDKTSAFNDNYLDKKALIDAEVQVAKDWATKTDGTVDGVDYSAKYYAQSILPIKDDITAVAEIATDVSDVAEIKDEVTAVAQDKENVDAVAENITNVNTVAGDHANIQTVVNNMTAINNAPTYANNSKIWAEGLDGEVAPLGGTHSSKGWAEIAEQAASGVQNPANRDLSNLTTAGQMIIDSVNGTISNCILEIPQNLKLTLENNVLTLKSGSILVLANGATYTTVQLANDLSRDISTIVLANNDKYVVICSATQVFSPIPLSRCASGNTLPANDDYTYYWYYKVDEQILYFKSPSDTTWRNVQASYPICILTRNSGEDTIFAKDSHGNDMIFNGAGFIGHHAFVYPNVKGLIPNEFNEDGTLKSIEINRSSLAIIYIATSAEVFGFTSNTGMKGNGYGASYSEVDELPTEKTTAFIYLKSENKMYEWASSGYVQNNLVYFLSTTKSGTIVTDFTIRQPVRLATTEMLDKVQDQVDTNTTAISGKAGLADNNTFTGGNTFRGQINQQTAANESGTTYYTYINQKVTNIDYTTNPSYNGYYYGIMFRDKNDKALAFITYGYGTAGNSNYTITVKTRNEDNSADVESSIAFNIARNGSASFTIPVPTQDNTTSTQADTVGARNTKLASLFTSITGYDASKAQTLHHDNSGNMTWVDD